MRDEHQRLAFAEFLDRLTRDEERPGDWFDLVVIHYRDEEQEEIRCRLVRLAIERDPKGSPVWLDSDREQIRSWSRLLLDVGAA